MVREQSDSSGIFIINLWFPPVWGQHACGQHGVTILHPGWRVLQNNSKICVRLFCVSLEEELGILRLCFITKLLSYHYFSCVTACPLFLRFLTYLIRNFFSLLFGTQRRPRTLKPFLQIKNRGHEGAFVPRRAPQSPAQSQSAPPIFFIFLFFYFFCLYRAAPAAHGSSQAELYWNWSCRPYSTATAMPDPSHLFNLHHIARQGWILNPLSEARDQTHILMDTHWVCKRWAITGPQYIHSKANKLKNGAVSILF